MRIIAGEFRGRRLLSPLGDGTRPITDRVKQSLFDILAPRLPGARVYDCFAGTGSMGLECLSRGAARATFFEADRRAVGLLRANIQTLGLCDSATVVCGDLFRWFRSDANPSNVDLVFLDPPYRFVRDRPSDMQTLALRIAEHHLVQDGWIVFRHDAFDALALPSLRLIERRTYGQMALDFLAKSE
jgi:16S rRNA (guanine966-N2)-methyltransferase